MLPSHQKSRHASSAGRRFLKSILFAAIAAAAYVSVGHANNFGGWSPARSVDPGRVNGVNTRVNDGCPIEAPDGGTLFFASNRNPASANPDATKDLDIWAAYRYGGQWLAPEPLPAPVNTAANEFCPTPLGGNQLLFVSTRSHTCGAANNADIYYTRLKQYPAAAWQEPTALPCSVNSAFEEFSPSLVETHGRTILFFSTSRESQVAGIHKIYSSTLKQDGTWGEAVPVTELNSGASDARPNVSEDGLEIVFDSNRAGSYDIYTATRSSINKPWSAPVALGPNVNDPVEQETRASLSLDGTRLHFGSTRANATLGGAASDIYVSTRPGRGRDDHKDGDRENDNHRDDHDHGDRDDHDGKGRDRR